MSTKEDESIDKSEWHPDGENAITPERAKEMGLVAEFDEDGNEMYGRANRHANVMRFLHTERFIDENELYWGDQFILCRQLWRVFCCWDKRSNQGEKGNRGGEGTREREFFMLIDRLPKHHYSAIEIAVDASAINASDKFAIRVYSKKFQSAFASLAHHFEAIRSEVKDSVDRESQSYHNDEAR